MIRGILAVLLIGASSACGRPPSGPRAALKRFPIGIFGVADPGQLDRLHDDGFDSFETGETDPKRLEELALEARCQAMRMVVRPDKLRAGPVSATKDWPVDTWFLGAELDAKKAPLAELEADSRKLRGWDPERPLTLSIGEGASAETYAPPADILMMGWFPVPRLKLDSPADEIDKIWRYMSPGKPFWMVVQAFEGREPEQSGPKKPGIGRFPNHVEIRFMSYLAIVHGASGLFFSTLSRPEGRTLFDEPELWQAVTRVAAELKSLQPILEGGRNVPFMYALIPEGLEARAWRYHGRDYVVLLNRREGFRVAVPDELLRPEWRPLFERRRRTADLLKRVGDDHYLEPYQVMVFEGPVHWRELPGLERIFGSRPAGFMLD